MGLPANVASDEWKQWLATTPPLPPLGYSAAYAFAKRLNEHLDAVPALNQLGKTEAREVAVDLLIYSEDLQSRIVTKIDIGLGSIGIAGASALGMVFIPGAQIPLALAFAGFGGFGALRRYDVWREQQLIEKLRKRISNLIRWLRA